MSDGNFNRSLLPHTPYHSGLQAGKAMARMQAIPTLQRKNEKNKRKSSKRCYRLNCNRKNYSIHPPHNTNLLIYNRTGLLKECPKTLFYISFNNSNLHRAIKAGKE